MVIKAGDTLTARSACDYDTVYAVQVVKRTPKTVTVVGTMLDGPTRCKVHTSDGGEEYVLAFGSYSMAPAFRVR